MISLFVLNNTHTHTQRERERERERETAPRIQYQSGGLAESEIVSR